MIAAAPSLAMPTSVLFACTHNAVRSPMAEGMLKHLQGHRIYVDSAGVRDGELDPFAVAVMEELGMDISRHHPKTFDDLEDDNFDLVVSLSPEAQHRAVEMTRTSACELAFWNILDPSYTEGTRDMRLQMFRQVRDDLLRRISSAFAPDRSPTV